jgi:diaminohydroxyphosphoribosylaminopyrimidine deaminase/5-amino-6-(5-phosphoribosylamino)uracil reductase
LIAAGITRVVSAIEDTDPRVAGRGHDMLRAAGITVDVGCLADQARIAHAGFFTRLGQNRPLVTLKLAMTLDGRIATQTGDSQWITGPEARRHVHAMRMRHDAVLVGAGTARADDPTLNVRGFGDDVPQPVRVVASRNLDIPLTSKLSATAKDVPVWLMHGASAPDMMVDAWTGIGARMFATEVVNGALNPVDMMAQLAEAGLTRVFCEGGGTLAASLLSHNLVDEIIVMNAGVVVGAEGQAGLGPMGISRLALAPRFRRVDVRALGDDIMHRWQRA